MSLTRRDFLSVAAALPAARVLAAADSTKPRLARRDCFFGLHFDLHPNKDDKVLGRDVTEEMVDHFLETVAPDFVQYDCKGHPGFVGYPSAVSTPTPGIVKDSLAIWRKGTARHGVSLFIHFSGVWDSLAVEQHPEWACVHADGSRDENATSTFGPYVDQRMIPQLKEVSQKYGLDGVWVDGDCWAVRPDYGAAAARAFREVTGIEPLPKGPSDRGWLEFLELNREQFRKYLRHYLDELHRSRPGFQIASNWMYSTLAPEKPEIPVDYLSGDYLGNAAISSARLDARYLSSTGKPWDLMAWGFQYSPKPKSDRSPNVEFVHKPAVQLEQEASVVLAQGGGFQIYYVPTRAGRLDERHIAVMAKVAGFCRARQTVCHKSETVPQAGVVFSRHSLYNTSGKLFGGWGDGVNPARGFIDAMLESHYSTDVIPDWKLEEVCSTYPLIVLPDWPDAGRQVKETLTRYVKGGGRLLIAGAENAALFAEELQVGLQEKPSATEAFIPGGEVFANVSGLWQAVEARAEFCLEKRYPTYDSTRDEACAATYNTFGSGKIAAIYGPVGAVFASTHAPAVRQLVDRVVSAIFEPDLKLKAPPTVDAVLRRQSGQLMLHLVNTTGMQVAGDYSAVDFIPPVGPVEISIRLPRQPSAVVVEPGRASLPGHWADGWWTGRLDLLEIHQVIRFG